MSVRVKKYWLRILGSETGQMSVFVAIMFQVLFVFFAMVINVGLVIHDKINLQNSVDLAAFYGAQRQAELMNEIAHINYQIRQDYKLFVWRYRVMGTLGRDESSGDGRTMPQTGNGQATDTPLPDVNNYGNPEEDPVVCVANQYWKEFFEKSSQNENYCYQRYNSSTPEIPIPPVIAGWIGANTAAADFAQQAQNLQRASCNNAAPLNWAFTMQLFYGYRLSIAVHKQMIKSLRKNLVDEDPKDFENNPIKTGVYKTLINNLTEQNRLSIEQNRGGSFDFKNGLTLGGCAEKDGEKTLPEVKIAPLLRYMYTYGNCTYTQAAHTFFLPAWQGQWDPSGIMTKMASGEPAAGNDDDVHSSLGFEKNPWCLAYVGVKATTKTRKPFAPFGSEFQLEARAYASPFGGRIGPWYQASWPRSSGKSSGGLRSDPLTPPRVEAGTPNYNLQTSTPNFSRYPGDGVGLKSQLAMGLTRHVLRGYGGLNTQGGGGAGAKLSLTWYGKFGTQIPEQGDALVGGDPGASRVREIETAVVAPDLYDIHYYSIDPQYPANYGQRSKQLETQRFKFNQFGHVMPDYGGTRDQMQLGNVQKQIETAMGQGFDATLRNNAYWVVRRWDNLLTGWMSQSAVKYDVFPVKKDGTGFGQCGVPGPGSNITDEQLAASMAPGKCITGGRVGYSVRLVSLDHLLGNGWTVGGEGEGAGAILNKPDPSF